MDRGRKGEGQGRVKRGTGEGWEGQGRNKGGTWADSACRGLGVVFWSRL